MIIGHLNALPLAGLPQSFQLILSDPRHTLYALQHAADGLWQPEEAAWFCQIGSAATQAREQRHTEYHRQWADIQILLEGEEVIYAGMQDVATPGDEERKADLFISACAPENVRILLRPGNFVIFMPGEPHQALCSVGSFTVPVRKAVFKVPRTMLEV